MCRHLHSNLRLDPCRAARAGVPMPALPSSTQRAVLSPCLLSPPPGGARAEPDVTRPGGGGRGGVVLAGGGAGEPLLRHQHVHRDVPR